MELYIIISSIISHAQGDKSCMFSLLQGMYLEKGNMKVERGLFGKGKGPSRRRRGRQEREMWSMIKVHYGHA
jgi:hypothetical protein